MNFGTQYNILLHKAYLDKGLSLTNYFKYLIAFFGIATSNVKLTMSIAVIWALVGYFLGYFWFRSNFVLAEAEISNQYNLFQKEVREKLK